MNEVELWRERIEQLLQWRIPKSWTLAPGGRDAKQQRDAYEAELRSKSFEEVTSIWQAEWDRRRQQEEAKAGLEESRRPFNLPDAKADFDYWAKMAFWSVEEAVLLLLGRDPRRVNRKHIDQCTEISAFARQFVDLLAIARRNVVGGQLSDPTWPGPFIAWAQRLDLTVPAEMLRTVEEHGVQISDWRTAFEQKRVQYDQTAAALEALTLSKNHVIEQLESKISQLESAPLRWPWGEYQTPSLQLLAETAKRYWTGYDRSEPSTAPTNADVVEWLMTQRGLSQNLASAIATILRDPDLPSGPRR
jgi:hypothetical protein